MKFQVNHFSTLLFTKQVLNRCNVFSMLIILSCLLFSFATYAVGKPDPSLVGYWPFNEKTGKKAEDASGNGNDGKLIDGPKWVEGKFGSALEFGGDGSYVEVADDPSLDLTNAATVMAWFKRGGRASVGMWARHQPCPSYPWAARRHRPPPAFGRCGLNEASRYCKNRSTRR